MRPPPGTVWLECSATVAGELLTVRQAVSVEAYEDPVTRQFIERSVREALMLTILNKWTPVITVIE